MRLIQTFRSCPNPTFVIGQMAIRSDGKRWLIISSLVFDSSKLYLDSQHSVPRNRFPTTNLIQLHENHSFDHFSHHRQRDGKQTTRYDIYTTAAAASDISPSWAKKLLSNRRYYTGCNCPWYLERVELVVKLLQTAILLYSIQQTLPAIRKYLDAAAEFNSTICTISTAE